MTKESIDKEALKFLIDHEIKSGRTPYLVTNAGFDVVSGNRRIEVRAMKGRMPIILNKKNIEALQNTEDYWLYIIYLDEFNRPNTLAKIHKQEILKRKNEHIYWEFQ